MGGKEFWTFMAIFPGLAAFVASILPSEYRRILDTWAKSLANYLTPYAFFEVPEFYGAGGNEIYDYVQTYLSSSTAIAAHHVSLCRPKNATRNTFSLAHNESIEEEFMGVNLWWTHHVSQRQGAAMNWGDVPVDEKRTYTLKIRKTEKTRVLEPYVEHVIATAKNLKDRTRDRLLYTNVKGKGGYNKRVWESVPFKHPSTFDTLAMDPEQKTEIKADLLDFTKGEQFYQRAGKAWKRGYLLYGPPGTGKSSMIAAIANFLQYDVYDVELTEVASNSELRKLLIQTTNRSVIVIEDIDCSLDLSERVKAQKKKAQETQEAVTPATKRPTAEDEISRVTLSGLLNFTDGLWSCCGSERIIIFTTNHIEKLDPALLRSGRMDMHIHMSWCTFLAFQVLAYNNLGLKKHELFPEVEKAISGKAITPAEVSELLIKKKRNPTAALEGLIHDLHKTKLASEIPEVNILEDKEDAISKRTDDSLLADAGSIEIKAKEEIKNPATIL